MRQPFDAKKGTPVRISGLTIPKNKNQYDYRMASEYEL